MEITGEGLTRGAGTVLAKMARDGRGTARLAIDAERRSWALLATAFERPIDARVLAKMRRAVALSSCLRAPAAILGEAAYRRPPRIAPEDGRQFDILPNCPAPYRRNPGEIQAAMVKAHANHVDARRTSCTA